MCHITRQNHKTTQPYPNLSFLTVSITVLYTMTNKKFKKTLFIFHRDLRLEDNTGLNDALKHSEWVIPCFIFTPDQIEHNSYRGIHCLQFMIESLEELHRELENHGSKLYLFYGNTSSIVEQCIRQLHVDRIVSNKDYTPYARRRDKSIEEICTKSNIAFSLFDDALLHPPEVTVKPNSRPPKMEAYTVFTPFYNNAAKLPVEKPEELPAGKFYNQPISFSFSAVLYDKILPERSKNLAAKGGLKAGRDHLNKILKLEKYATDRDFPALDMTSGLSPYLKFTIISPREIYYRISRLFGTHHELIRALYWRDFFTCIAYFFPHVFQGAFHPKYDRLEWSDDKLGFQKWCNGETGFPLVDAGMRELNATGLMHNRVRMVVASFLTKDLHIHWKLGEKYFAQKLIDYDPAVNNGNWQWAASTGCDAQPYFRIFNPWLQQMKFDPDCMYIKKWVPELQSFSPKVIHNLFKTAPNHRSYPDPIIAHDVESKVALARYKNVR